MTIHENLTAQGVDAEILREHMRQVVSPVTVITAGSGERAYGITIGSFTSTSMEPPLVVFNLSRGSFMHEVLPSEERFVVHLLGADQESLSERFARTGLTGAEQFDELDFTTDPDGIPVLAGVLSIFRCTIYNVFPAGDHSLIVGLVDSIEAVRKGPPLVYLNQSYGSVGSTVNLGSNSTS